MNTITLLPSDENLQKMFRLAYFLHPHRLTALYVTLDACSWIPHLRRMMERRLDSQHPHKQKIPEECIYQFAVYAASQSWEQDQESEAPKKKIKYQPTTDDQLIRYVEFLIWKTMDRSCCYVAVAIGHLLYSYHLSEIASLAPDFFREDNIRRVNSNITSWVKGRFANSGFLLNAENKVDRRQATDHERSLVHASLEILAPKLPAGPQAISIDMPLLETLFSRDSSRPESERIRAIVDPTVAGFEHLVNEYNASMSDVSDEQLSDPRSMLYVPKVNEKVLLFSKPAEQPSEDAHRVSPDPLTDTEITAIKHPRKRGT